MHSKEERVGGASVDFYNGSTAGKCRNSPLTHRLSILQNAKLEDVRSEPFPHSIVENALPESIYSEIEKVFFSEEVIIADTT